MKTQSQVVLIAKIARTPMCRFTMRMRAPFKGQFGRGGLYQSKSTLSRRLKPNCQKSCAWGLSHRLA